jgi:hypothetical protein
MTDGETEQANARARRPERAPSLRRGHTEESGVTDIVAGPDPRPGRGG